MRGVQCMCVCVLHSTLAVSLCLKMCQKTEWKKANRRNIRNKISTDRQTRQKSVSHQKKLHKDFRFHNDKWKENKCTWQFFNFNFFYCYCYCCCCCCCYCCSCCYCCCYPHTSTYKGNELFLANEMQYENVIFLWIWDYKTYSRSVPNKRVSTRNIIKKK